MFTLYMFMFNNNNLVLHSSGVGHVCLVPGQSDDDVGAGLPLQLLHPGLGSREGVLEGETCLSDSACGK